MSHLAYKIERRKIELLAFYSANNYTAVNKLTKIGKHCFSYSFSYRNQRVFVEKRGKGDLKQPTHII